MGDPADDLQILTGKGEERRFGLQYEPGLLGESRILSQKPECTEKEKRSEWRFHLGGLPEAATRHKPNQRSAASSLRGTGASLRQVDLELLVCVGKGGGMPIELEPGLGRVVAGEQEGHGGGRRIRIGPIGEGVDG